MRQRPARPASPPASAAAQPGPPALSRRALLAGTALGAAGLAARPALARAALAPARAAVSRAGADLGAGAGQHAITFDPYSLMIDGTRLFVWSGEFHPFRLPSPSLWLDILQKMKASGYNAVCMYFNWSYHSPAPGDYDFSGVRDMDLVLRMAADTGLYVLARPGPYINGELNAGGFPGWLTSTAAVARTDDPIYLGYADEWLTAIDAILARHQLTDGGGTLLLYQIENEYASYVTSATGINYMAHLYAKVRADGITVPIYHNDKGRNGDWVPGSFPAPDSNYLYAFDGYPSASGAPPDWGYYGPGGAKGGASASPATPGFEAEFGGGYFDPWGGAPWHGQGYGYERAFDGPGLRAPVLPDQRGQRDQAAQRVHDVRRHLVGLAARLGRLHLLRLRGGDQRGPPAHGQDPGHEGDGLPAAGGARHHQDRQGRAGQRVQLAGGDLSPGQPRTPAPSSTSCATTTPRPQAFTLPVTAGGGSYTVPQSGTLQLDGKDMKVIVADYRLGSARLVYTTSQLMTQAAIGAQDVAVLASRPGDDGETVLRYPAAAQGPAVAVLAGGGVTSSWDASTGDLRVNYPHQGVTRILVTPASGRPLLLLAVDDTAAATIWPVSTAGGLVLVSGPALVRTRPPGRPGAGAGRRHRGRHHAGGLGARAPRPPDLERPPGAGQPDRVGQPGHPGAAARAGRRAAARAGPLAVRGGEPGGRSRLRRQRLDGGGQDHVGQRDPGAGRAAGAVRRRLRVPLRRRLVPRQLVGHGRRHLGEHQLPDRPGGHVPGLAGRRVPRLRHDAGAHLGPGHHPGLGGHGAAGHPGRRPGRRPPRAGRAGPAHVPPGGRRREQRVQAGPRPHRGHLHRGCSRGDLAHPGHAGRRGTPRPAARPAEQRRPVRRAGRLVPARSSTTAGGVPSRCRAAARGPAWPGTGPRSGSACRPGWTPPSA